MGYFSDSRQNSAGTFWAGRGSETVNNYNNNSILLQFIQIGKASV